MRHEVAVFLLTNDQNLKDNWPKSCNLATWNNFVNIEQHMSDPEVSPARVNPGQHGPGSQLASLPAQQQRWITKFVGITNHGLVISTWKVYCGFTGFLIIKLQLALAFNTLGWHIFWSKIGHFSIGTRHKSFWHFTASWRLYWFHQLQYGIFQSMCYCFFTLLSNSDKWNCTQPFTGSLLLMRYRFYRTV